MTGLSGWTLRRKLVASILALFVVVIVATGTATVVAARRTLGDQLDAQVRSTADRAPRMPPLGSGDLYPGPGLGGDFLLVEVEDGVVLRSIAFDQDGAVVRLTDDQLLTLANASLDATPRTVDLGGRLGAWRLVQSIRRNDVYITGLPLRAMDATLARLSAIIVAVGALGFLLVGAASAWLVRANLRPLQRVAKTATRVSRVELSSGEVSLTQRVGPEDTDLRTEVGQVGAALNDLLDHVDRSLQARHASETRLRRFVADASHELRTPLASISGYAELSRRESAPVPDSIAHALSRIGSEAGRMTSLVEDLLLLARLDAGRPLERDAVDLTVLAIDAVSDLRAAGPEHKWRLNLPEDSVELIGDKARLTQAVVNLLNNARVHTPPGTMVTARVRREADVAVVSVEDDGPGIAPALLPEVFDRFTRGDSARVRNGGSTGLGLSIVQAVATAHGGAVEVSSRPGQTRFTLRLPVAGPPLAPAA